MSGDFGIGDIPPPISRADAELRAADAQRPSDYRNALDRAGAGISVRVVIVIIAIAAVLWFLRSFRA